MKVIGITDIGLIRKKNEDSLLIDEAKGLFVICDGMGGHNAGDVASKLAVQVMEKEINELPLNNNALEVLNKSIQKANKLIYIKGNEKQEWHEMGTTITAAFINEGHISVANVGDSCLYIIRRESIYKVTRDHTLAERMVIDGLLKKEEIRSSSYNHILTRALGIEEKVLIDNFEEEIFPGDIILICSDGLSDVLEDDEIMSIINSNIRDIEKSAQQLLEQALLKGGNDNITFILYVFD